MNASPFPLEPEPRGARGADPRGRRLVLAHVASLAEQPPFDLDGVEALRASFREPLPETAGPSASSSGGSGRDRQELQHRRPRLSRLHPRRGRLRLGARRLHRHRHQPIHGRHRGGAGPGADRGDVRRLAVHADGPACRSRGILTSGGSLSNFSALVTAREERLGEDFQDASIYLSEETHHCVAKAARLAGFPRASLRTLPTDARFRLVPEALEAAIREDRTRAGGRSSSSSTWARRTPAPWIPCPRSSGSPASTASGSTPTPPTAASSGWPREARRSCAGSRTATRSPSTRTRASSCRTASGRSSCATGRRSSAPTAAAPATSRT